MRGCPSPSRSSAPSGADDDALASRDYRGVVQPWHRPLTDAEIAFLTADDDLATASVRSVIVDESSEGREIGLGGDDRYPSGGFLFRPPLTGRY